MSNKPRLSKKVLDSIIWHLDRSLHSYRKIAEIHGCSVGVVGDINRRFKVRDYGLAKKSWRRRDGKYVIKLGSGECMTITR